MKLKWPRWKRYNPEDFSAYLPQGPQSTKEKLIVELKRRGISVHVDDVSETSTGAYAELRAVASEAELQSRLLQALASEVAASANRIAWLALLVGFAGLIIAVLR